MIRRPPRATRTDTLFPYTTLFRSQAFGRRCPRQQGAGAQRGEARIDIHDAIAERSGMPRFRRQAETLQRGGSVDQRHRAAIGGVAQRDLGAQPVHRQAALEVVAPRGLDVAKKLVALRSDTRRVGKECVSTCSSRWSLVHSQNTPKKSLRNQSYIKI